MTVDISALASTVRQMDISATLKTFTALFAFLTVLYFLNEIFVSVQTALRFDLFESGDAVFWVAVVATTLLTALTPALFVVRDWLVRKPYRRLSAFTGLLLGVVGYAVVGGALGGLVLWTFWEFELDHWLGRLVAVAAFGALLGLLTTLLIADSRRVRRAAIGLFVAIVALAMGSFLFVTLKDAEYELTVLFERLLGAFAVLIVGTLASRSFLRVIRNSLIRSADRPRELLLGALYRKGLMVRLAYLTGLPSSLWHWRAIRRPAFWAFLLSRPSVYGGALLLLSDAYVSQGVFITVAGGVSLIVGGHALFFAGKRLAARYVWQPENPDDPRPPVLFLRSFEDDQLEFRRPWWNLIGRWYDLWSFRRNADETMIDEIAQYGPVVALGMPGESRVPFGANRYYSTDRDWKRIVTETATSARAIIVAAGNTPGVLWEYELLATHGLLDRTVVLFPAASDSNDTRNADALAALSRVAGISRDHEPDEGREPVALIPVPEREPVLLTSRRATAAAYVVALRAYFQNVPPRQLADPLVV